MPRIIALILAGWLASASTALAGPSCTTKDGWYFSLTERGVKMAAHFAVQGDKAAFDRLIATGQLRPLKEGVPVYIEPGGGIGIRAIRIPGSTSHVWVPKEALDCKR